jgi:hypothetical protein
VFVVAGPARLPLDNVGRAPHRRACRPPYRTARSSTRDSTAARAPTPASPHPPGPTPPGPPLGGSGREGVASERTGVSTPDDAGGVAAPGSVVSELTLLIPSKA